MPYSLKIYDLLLKPSGANKDRSTPRKPNPADSRITYNRGPVPAISPGSQKRDRRNPKGELALADTEKLGAADRANALDGRPLVLQNDRSRVLDFPLGPAFHAICLSHGHTSNITLA